MTQALDVDPSDKYWSIQEYDQLVRLGVFDRQRLELVFGRIVQISPQRSRHSMAIEYADDYLRQVYLTGHRIRNQMPLRLVNDSEPEPDLAVIVGELHDAPVDHPTAAVLVIEVSDTTLRYDRKTKAKLYALAGIPEYWIVNLVDNCIEVHRDPDSNGTFRFRKVINRGSTIRPLNSNREEIDAAELLP